MDENFSNGKKSVPASDDLNLSGDTKKLDTAAIKNESRENADSVTEDIISYYADTAYVGDSNTSEESGGSDLSSPCGGANSESAIPPETVVITQKKDFSIDINPQKSDKPYFIYVTVTVAALLLIGLGFFIGRFIVPVSDSEIDEEKLALAKDDSTYQSANTENLALKASISSLEEENENITAVFDEVLEYQKTLEAAQSTHDEQQAALDSINSQLSELKKEYEELDSEMTKIKAETVVFSPGTYTVGEHIPAGDYSVSGNGSLLLASSDNNLKINDTLYTDVPQLYTLSEGDIIRLETSAEFVPVKE